MTASACSKFGQFRAAIEIAVLSRELDIWDARRREIADPLFVSDHVDVADGRRLFSSRFADEFAD